MMYIWPAHECNNYLLHNDVSLLHGNPMQFVSLGAKLSLVGNRLIGISMLDNHGCSTVELYGGKRSAYIDCYVQLYFLSTFHVLMYITVTMQ